MFLVKCYLLITLTEVYFHFMNNNQTHTHTVTQQNTIEKKRRERKSQNVKVIKKTKKRSNESLGARHTIGDALRSLTFSRWCTGSVQTFPALKNRRYQRHLANVEATNNGPHSRWCWCVIEDRIRQPCPPPLEGCRNSAEIEKPQNFPLQSGSATFYSLAAVPTVIWDPPHIQ